MGESLSLNYQMVKKSGQSRSRKNSVLEINYVNSLPKKDASKTHVYIETMQ